VAIVRLTAEFAYWGTTNAALVPNSVGRAELASTKKSC
jgi:hypothetical protein